MKMQTVKRTSLLVALVIFVGTSSVVSQNLGACIDILVNRDPDLSFCESVDAHIKCLIRELDLVQFPLSSQIIQTLQDRLSIQFIGCDIDLEDLLEEVRQEQQPTTTSAPETTTPPASGFDSATTTGECTDALTEAVLAASGQLSCTLVSDFTKCILRVTNFVDSNPSDQDIQTLEDRLEAELRVTNALFCNLDLFAIVDELRGQNSTTAAPSTTTTTTTTTTTMTTTTPEPTTESPIFRPRGCVVNRPDGCRRRNDGDYRICGSACRSGNFVSCSNGILYVRDCAIGWYVDDNGNRFTAPLVFNPITQSCERSTFFCPRSLDRFLEGR